MMNENLPVPEVLPSTDHLKVFVVRHGQSDYLEREHVKETGHWNPEMDDLNSEGKATVNETAQTMANMIDPEKDIVIFLSSPRARAITTQRLIAACFSAKGIQIDEAMSSKIEALRSGGNDSPVADKQGKVVNPDATIFDPSHLEDEGSEPVSGDRFRETIAFFSSISGSALQEQIKQGFFNHKRPVFVVITHGEALHAQGVPFGDYKTSFMGAAFPEHRLVKLPRGKFFMLDFDTNHQASFSVTLPSEISPSHQQIEKKLKIDQSTGAITPEVS